MAQTKPVTSDNIAADPAETPESGIDPALIVQADQPKTFKVKSPAGAVTEVPESIIDALLGSDYKRTK